MPTAMYWACKKNYINNAKCIKNKLLEKKVLFKIFLATIVNQLRTECSAFKT